MLPWPRRREYRREEGFTLVEALIATTLLVFVMAAVGPVFYGAMRLTGITNQRGQATNVAVAAIEQMRSLPYGEVGYQVTPSSCAGTGKSPVSLASSSPLDALSASTVVGRTTYTVDRCVYWSGSSIPGTSQSYKQTVVKVSWPAPGGELTVTETSALYPGGYRPDGAPPNPLPGPELAPSCEATRDGANPTSMIDLTLIPVVGTNPSAYRIYYTTYAPTAAIPSGSDPYTTTQVSTTTPTVTVGPGTTYYFQVAAVWEDGTVSGPSTTCSASTTLPTVTTHASAASATALKLALAGSTTPYTLTSPSTSATNDGTGSNSPTTVQPTVSIPGADSFVSVAAASQTAEANADGSSYACAGLLSTGETLDSGSSAGPCGVSGSGSAGISVNLAGLPGVGSAVSSLVAGLVLKFNATSSWATAGTGGASAAGSASLSGATVIVTPLGGLLPAQTIALSLPGTLTSPTDVLQAMMSAIGANAVVGSLANSLHTALASVLTLTGDYQTTANGVLAVSALHFGVLSGTGTGDLALSSVGPNTTQTVTSTGPCSINSLSVSPPGLPSGANVVLTSSGALAQGNSLQLSVNVSSGCSNVEVGYAPSGCTPGSPGCATSYAAMTGTSGTYYGSAGSTSTVWSAGTMAFTVFTGTSPVVYSPLTRQQVIMCTEKGDSGQC